MMNTGDDGPGRPGRPGGSPAALGRAGEEAAGRYLEAQGYRVVERNYRCRSGEIDIIARDGDVLCFVEVKARRTGAYGRGIEAVEARKRQRMRRAAAGYLQRFGSHPPVCRFDAAEVWLSPDGRPDQVWLVRNAF